MAFSSNGGNGFRSTRRGGAGLAEINITPFVDVLLVLLIIFMLTAHVMEFGLEIDVPRTRYVKDTSQQMPVVSIKKDGTTYLNETPININDVAQAIIGLYGKTKGVYVRADRQTIWDPIAQVIATLGAAGIQVNMVTRPEDDSGKGRR
jgi:biopolymer transport protein ExbD